MVGLTPNNGGRVDVVVAVVVVVWTPTPTPTTTNKHTKSAPPTKDSA